MNDTSGSTSTTIRSKWGTLASLTQKKQKVTTDLEIDKIKNNLVTVKDTQPNVSDFVPKEQKQK